MFQDALGREQFGTLRISVLAVPHQLLKVVPRTFALSEGDGLTGWLTDPSGTRVTWTAARAPSLQRTGAVEWNDPVEIFNGRDTGGWHAQQGASQWVVIDHTLTSPKSGANLVSDRTFMDFTLHVEFRYPKGSNSGIYLRGRYEVQIEDSTGLENATDRLGAVFGFLAPSEDVAKKPGDWQAFDIVLTGRMVTVILNGTTIIANQEIPGITGGALDSNEAAPGPIVLQGDHGPIEFRKIIVKPSRPDSAREPRNSGTAELRNHLIS